MQRISLRALLIFALLASFLTPAAASGSHRYNSQQAAPGDFDYYLLALSWAPNFCATNSGNASECGTGRHIAFVLHGLWPQSEQGRLNQPCQHTSPVAQDVVTYALNFYPSASLVQHEWQCHGVYSGLSASDYFTAAGRAYQSLHIPPALTTLSQSTQENSSALIQQFQQSNSAPAGAFVTSCHSGELVAVEACFTKDMQLRPCAPSLHSCSGSLLLLPPR
jgi:ribonuclease T2